MLAFIAGGHAPKPIQRMAPEGLVDCGKKCPLQLLPEGQLFARMSAEVGFKANPWHWSLGNEGSSKLLDWMLHTALKMLYFFNNYRFMIESPVNQASESVESSKQGWCSNDCGFCFIRRRSWFQSQDHPFPRILWLCLSLVSIFHSQCITHNLFIHSSCLNQIRTRNRFNFFIIIARRSLRLIYR